MALESDVGHKNISATIIADSISPDGQRITTFELEYPRFIHAEFMTHRLFSRNAASSRAIPVKTQLDTIMENTAQPIHWGANQAGMQARSECTNLVNIGDRLDGGEKNLVSREEAWLKARDHAILLAERFNDAKYHKQIVNRLTEPFSHIKVVCTATDYENFFWLRCHPDAQPEIQELANQMFKCREESTPEILQGNEWHLPYVDDSVIEEAATYLNSNPNQNLTLTDLLLRISASCCAQVSYRKTDTSVPKALRIYDLLVATVPVHASPFEHQATPILSSYSDDHPGITHTVHRDKSKWSGNFRGWIQYRQLIPDHTKW